MGLAPFSYSNKVSVHTKQNKSTKGLLSPNVIWSFFVFFIQLTGFMALMLWNIFYDYRKYTLSAMVPDALSILTKYSTCFASLIGAVLNRRKMEILMMNFTAVDQILLHENCDGIYRKTQRILLLELSLFLFLLIGFYCYHVYVWTEGTSYIYFIAKDLANLSNVIMVIQYINIMQILRHRFRKLNQQLATCCDSKSRIPDHSIIKFRNSNNHLHIRTTQIANTANNLTDKPKTQNYILSDISVPMINNGPEEVSWIHTLRQTYSDLYDITESINGIYGYQITLELAYDFVTFVSCLYYSTELTSNVNKTGELSLLRAASSLCWVTQTVVRILSITASCFAAGEEARRTGTVVHKILLRQTLPRDTSTELQLFSLQLLSNKVEFSAGGFFPVNLSLAYSMVGAATTYIIILFQFK
jgi:gustatory receptor